MSDKSSPHIGLTTLYIVALPVLRETVKVFRDLGPHQRPYSERILLETQAHL